MLCRGSRPLTTRFGARVLRHRDDRSDSAERLEYERFITVDRRKVLAEPVP